MRGVDVMGERRKEGEQEGEGKRMRGGSEEKETTTTDDDGNDSSYADADPKRLRASPPLSLGRSKI